VFVRADATEGRKTVILGNLRRMGKRSNAPERSKEIFFSDKITEILCQTDGHANKLSANNSRIAHVTKH